MARNLWYISTHALREEGDSLTAAAYCWPLISTHALREEGDPRAPDTPPRPGDFYPRPPRGGRPLCTRRTGGCRPISTHALREEGDMANNTVLYSSN